MVQAAPPTKPMGRASHTMRALLPQRFQLKNFYYIYHARHTRGIKHWGLSGYSNILPHIKFGVAGQ
ncbi:hypothetical protein SAMN05216323_11277 [Williamwhitmania taraxaci]|uniref:Uncharacterized protein n=1 Tax=Williamwhitmania taraxaci TaxID=1640674 RepID=A0A1G6TM89_9BACT|nr:hypothetical protein SAMN05216323_11277 [Williamwhitmania taraxaci]